MNETEIPYNPKSINPIDEYVEVKTSEIHGLGLFAKKFIRKGTIWWHARPQDVLIIMKKQFLKLDSSQKTSMMNDFMKTLLNYSYYERDLDALIFCLDNSRFVNHSFEANSGASEDENGFCAMALKDINPGEEITEDYSKYTLCPWLEKYREYFDPTCW
ncbi:MAG: SET domain-containing protein [Promethearchaeota archaeon]|nr:MAG: SET domain-containing protein [Candidatus Lokiarchaeota archaeon]